MKCNVSLFKAWVVLSLPCSARRTRNRKTATFFFRGSIAFLTIAAMVLMIGCAGISTSTKTVTDPGRGASTHTVDLSWMASTSNDVSGYNIYRAEYTNLCGSFSRLNPEPIATTWYTDSQVMNGASYCYATTAVDPANQESGYSNIIEDIQIPAS